MFGSKKRKEMAEDPQKGLDFADKRLNKGLNTMWQGAAHK